MKLRAKEILATCDENLGSLLRANGFANGQPGEYLRADTGGEDFVLVAPDVPKERFAIALSYYPNDCSAIQKLVGMPLQPRGFPCGPYLNGVGVGRRPHWWSCKSADRLRIASQSAASVLKAHGLPWLQRLMDPDVFATEVDPVDALYAGYAHERAGKFSLAREFYQEMLRRLIEGMNLGVSDAEYLKVAGREFIFVAKKLGLVDERIGKYERALGEVLDVKPLPA